MWDLMTDSQKEAVIEGRHAKHIAKLQLKHGANWEQVLKDENEKRAARYDQEDGDAIAEGQLADHENEQYDKEQGATPPAPYEPGEFPMRRRAAAMRDAMDRVDETETPLPDGGAQAGEYPKRRNKMNVRPPKEDPEPDDGLFEPGDFPRMSNSKMHVVPSEYAIN